MGEEAYDQGGLSHMCLYVDFVCSSLIVKLDLNSGGLQLWQLSVCVSARRHEHHQGYSDTKGVHTRLEHGDRASCVASALNPDTTRAATAESLPCLPVNHRGQRGGSIQEGRRQENL